MTRDRREVVELGASIQAPRLGEALRSAGALNNYGLPKGDADALRTSLSALRRADVLQSASKLMMAMERVGTGLLDVQAELVQVFPPDLQRRVRTLLDTPADEGGVDVVFYPQQLLSLQKLAYAFSQPGPPTSFDNGASWPRFLEAAAQVADVINGHALIAGDNFSAEDAAIDMMRNAYANRVAFYRAVGGRAFHLWLQPALAWPADLETPDDYAARRFGMALHDFAAIAITPALMRVNVASMDPKDALFEPAQYFSTTAFADVDLSPIFRGLAFEPEPAPDPLSQATYWSFFDLAERPYHRAPDPLLAVSSVRFAFERATSGIFWMLHAAHAGDVGRLTAHFGRMFEDYCWRLADSVAGESLSVSKDFAYQGRYGSEELTVDVICTTQSNGYAGRLFVECAALRPIAACMRDCDKDAFRDYLRRVIDEVRQLDRVTRDFVEGRFTIPGDLAGSDSAIFPVVVLDEPFTWSSFLKELLEERLRSEGLLSHPQVGPLSVCSLSEYEHLLSVHEKGANAIDAVRRYCLTGRADSLDHFLYEQHGKLQVPSMVNDGFRGLEALMRERLFGTARRRK